MADERVVVRRDGSIATLLLNRPEKLNPLDQEMCQELADALSAVAREPGLRVAVITGAGRGFCSGGDIQKMFELKSKGQTSGLRGLLVAGHDLVRQIRRLPKPVLASVNGPAAGAGMNLALACDLRLASDQATFSQAFIRIGLHPDFGGTFFLPRLVGIGRAMEMFTLAEPLAAAEAHGLGLVNFLVPHRQLAEETHKLAQRLAEAPPLPLALLKRGLYRHLEAEADEALDYEIESQIQCFESADFAEGLGAYLEKRRPNFSGS